ncbi:ester cyclase [Actinosynnema sp. NPDC047251]|uniref:Ester cyclase n=1 Tax=Saccharothrix espanaensis (strain ATCC 51144 / DSM 44229 / JCM 9112 / NBRC 15066 / NRRL 15764) TaxID=1179773 RepID=K0K634_SACES|nr:ester cyclase [Saccharothrix espanaensis]CCH32013.1 hypothetical protein BN6_47350 [Saccharothrix espanaensis DSM 44229]
MSIEVNKEVARRYYEEFVNQRRLDVVDEIIAEDAVDEAAGGQGRDGFRQHATWLWETVEDVRTTITELVAEDDRVVVYWRMDGVHRGNMFGVPGTGRRFVGHSVSHLTFRDGQVVRYRVLPDRLGILQQVTP